MFECTFSDVADPGMCAHMSKCTFSGVCVCVCNST